MINGVGVEFGGSLFACMAVPDEKLGFVFLCGKCTKGRLVPIIGDTCFGCGAVVRYVDDGPEFHVATMPMPPFKFLGIGNTALEVFLSALALMNPSQREATMRELEDRVCLFCGAADPECPCWLGGEEAEVVS